MARLTYFSSAHTSLWRGALALVEGLLCAFYIGYSNTGALRVDQALRFFLFSLTGGFIAWAFWWIARDFPERSQPK